MLRLLEYLVVRALLAALQSIPYGLSLRLARTFGRLAYRFDSTPRSRTIANVRLAFAGALGDAAVDGIARGVFETIARHVVEAAHVARRVDRALRLENEDILKEAYARGRGVVLVSAHLGCFVRMVAIPRLVGVRSAVIMKKQRNDRVLQWGIRTLKRRFDLDVIPKKEARDQVAQLLEEGCVVGFFADQHPRKGGFPARFFGHEVLAASGAAVYAKRYDCPLVVCTAALHPDGTHVLRFDGPVPTEGSFEEVSQRWLDLLERRIRDHPEQWMWMHRRWRDLRCESEP